MNAVSCHLKEEDSDNHCLFARNGPPTLPAAAAGLRRGCIIKIVKYGDDGAASAAPREVAVAAIDPLSAKIAVIISTAVAGRARRRVGCVRLLGEAPSGMARLRQMRPLLGSQRRPLV
jgi:hypothetical protein